MGKAPTTIDEYLASVEPAKRAALESLRQTVRALAPGVEETISYQIPTFKLSGRMLVSFAVFKDHCSIFPGAAVREALSDDLKGFKGGKGTVQFTTDHPLPTELVEKIVRLRVADTQARAKKKV